MRIVAADEVPPDRPPRDSRVGREQAGDAPSRRRTVLGKVGVHSLLDGSAIRAGTDPAPGFMKAEVRAPLALDDGLDSMGKEPHDVPVAWRKPRVGH